MLGVCFSDQREKWLLHSDILTLTSTKIFPRTVNYKKRHRRGGQYFCFAEEETVRDGVGEVTFKIIFL